MLHGHNYEMNTTNITLQLIAIAIIFVPMLNRK